MMLIRARHILLAILMSLCPVRLPGVSLRAAEPTAAADGIPAAEPVAEAPEDPRLGDGVAYTVAFQGPTETALETALEMALRDVSITLRLRDRVPPTVGLLRRRVTRDVENLQQTLHQFGYFSGSVTPVLELDQDPVTVTFRVEPGPVYRLQALTLTWEGEPPALPEAEPPTGFWRRGEPFRAAQLPLAGDALLRHLRENGYPQPTIADRQIRVEHSDASVHITYRVQAGRPGYLRSISFHGLSSVKESYLRRLATWPAGQPYDQRLLDAYRDRLSETGLFDAIRIVPQIAAEPPPAALDAAGRVPVDLEVTLEQALMRTVYAGIGYNTYETLFGRLGWEHLNRLGEGETLGLDLTVSPIELDAGLAFEKPAFRRADQKLRLDLAVKREDFDAYYSESIAFREAIERQLTADWAVSVGLSQRLGAVEQFGERDPYLLLKLPLGLTYDGRDDRLHPREGIRWHLELIPSVDVIGATVPYLKAITELRYYWEIFDHPDWILATRLELGSIVGAAHGDIPADDRFYAGGGNSLRAYGFQEVGPYVGDTNVGGRALLETSMELRWQMTDTLGWAAFVDAGATYRSEYPDFSEPLQVGGGIGLRYFTAIGPIRVDLAVPFNPDHDVHAPFQFYVSIGQAF